MLSRSEWNLAGKTACDAMEKVGKAIELLSGISTTKHRHDVRIVSDVLNLVPLVAWQIDKDPMTTVSLFVQKNPHPMPHITLAKCVHGTVTTLDSHGVAHFGDLMLAKEGSDIVVIQNLHPVAAVTDTAGGLELDGNWVQLVLNQAAVEILNKYVATLSKDRNLTAYHGRPYSGSEAQSICEDGRRLFIPMKRRVGYRTGRNII